jgi:hypothetical protein
MSREIRQARRIKYGLSRPSPLRLAQCRHSKFMRGMRKGMDCEFCKGCGRTVAAIYGWKEPRYVKWNPDAV